jgi:hypothetical protein
MHETLESHFAKAVVEGVGLLEDSESESLNRI